MKLTEITYIHCNKCHKEFPADVLHDCRITRKQLEEAVGKFSGSIYPSPKELTDFLCKELGLSSTP